MQTSSPQTQATLRIGTRGSPLALAQAKMVREGLCRAHGLSEDEVSIHVISTTGDRVQDRPLSELGGKGLFTKEIETALLQDEIDLAVHSMKDVPTVLPDGLLITNMLPREDPRDAFFSPVAQSIADLPQGAIVGSASLRRAAQVRALRPDVEVVNFRGNLDTRLEKLRRGDVHATFLALAGIKRLGIEDKITAIIDEKDMLPAVAQGAIGIETREGDAATREKVAALGHQETQIAVACERAFLATLDGSCRTPIAGLAKIIEGELSFRGLVIRADGSEILTATRQGPVGDAADMGEDAGKELLAQGAATFIEDE